MIVIQGGRSGSISQAPHSNLHTKEELEIDGLESDYLP